MTISVPFAILAGELARALLFARPPEWADEDVPGQPPGQAASARRLSAMASLAATAPKQGGLALAGELCSPHLDTHQRLLILESLMGAAQRMRSSPTALMPPAAGCVFLLDFIRRISVPERVVAAMRRRPTRLVSQFYVHKFPFLVLLVYYFIPFNLSESQ